jgi:hypothetical protein
MSNKYYTTAFFTVALIITSTQASAISSRVYCFYIPNAKLTLSPPAQIQSKVWEKMENRKIDVQEGAKGYLISERDYEKLFDDCQKLVVKTKGQMLELQGSDAAGYETIAPFRRISMNIPNSVLDDPDKKVLLLDDTEVLKKLGLDQPGQEAIAAIIKNSGPDIKQILADVAKGNSSWTQAIKNVSGNDYVRGALLVAGILATAWFAPAYVAAGVEVLYPLVYQALWGVPSKWGVSYWLVYYPGKAHAVAWAYNNSGAIITAASTLIGLARNLTAQLSKKEVKDKLSKSQVIIPKS